MFRFLVIAAFVPVMVFGLSNPQQCRSGTKIPYAISITGCSQAPCDLIIGTTMQMAIDFSAPKVLVKPVARVYAESLGMTGEYELPAEQANVCGNLALGSCPLDADEDATFTLEMPIDDIYPITDMYLEVAIEEAGSEVVCFRLPARTRA